MAIEQIAVQKPISSEIRAAVHDARQQVATIGVGAEQKLRARGLQPLRWRKQKVGS